MHGSDWSKNVTSM